MGENICKRCKCHIMYTFAICVCLVLVMVGTIPLELVCIVTLPLLPSRDESACHPLGQGWRFGFL